MTVFADRVFVLLIELNITKQLYSGVEKIQNRRENITDKKINKFTNMSIFLLKYIY